MKFVFLDLDGTLTDPAPGLLNSIFYALKKIQLPHFEASGSWIIGPPIWPKFEKLGVEKASLANAVALYREIYTDIGWPENSLYDKVLEQLSILKGQGSKLYIATPKHYSYTKKITAYFGTSDFMTCEFGIELDGTRSDKTSLLTHGLVVAGDLAESGFKIGDRCYDDIGAKNNRIKVVGASYGYGENTELIDSDADAPISDISEFSYIVTSFLPLKECYNGQD